MGSNACESLWPFVLSCVMLMLEAGRRISMGRNECESLWLFVLSCGGVHFVILRACMCVILLLASYHMCARVATDV